MSKTFLDANILIDLVSPERPNHSHITEFLLFSDTKDLYISTLSVHIAFYVLKIKPHTKRCSEMKILLNSINIIPLTESIIKKPLDQNYSDFEDCLQYLSAIDNCDYLLTRDKKDFEKIQKIWPSQIKIVSNPKDIKN
jgi:predicted nucleic acid-binding protein